ncbi:MAG TPA: contractile injection system tape measure protein [Allosphingosinicella sp.]|nr:contractile injection system tape measure protein [Allosphingosinicella sp.]
MDWRCADARGRAVHLLQYLVDGECGQYDWMLTLNKLLCGQPPDQPAVAAIKPDEAELAACRALQSAVLVGWTAMGDNSFVALRETFLERYGEIIETPSGWRVRVERKTVDVLLDQLPWSFSMIHHPWMDKPISVEW